MEIAGFMHCGLCLQERPPAVSPHDYSRLSIGVDPEGGLVIQCNRHNVQFVHWANNEVAKELSKLVDEPCCNCGGSCKDKETRH